MSTKNPPVSLTSDSIYLAMRDRIVSGQWKPGKRLKQRTLAKEFGSSCIPVLESLRRLESELLVTSHPNVGAQVKTWTEHEVHSVYAARTALESVTCRLFAEQASPDEKAKAADISRLFDQQLREGCPQKCVEIDIQFHLYIMNRSLGHTSKDALSALAQNALLLSVTIRSITDNRLPESGLPKSFGSSVVGAHEALIRAFDAGDGDAAELAIRDHIGEARQTVLQAINTPGFRW